MDVVFGGWYIDAGEEISDSESREEEGNGSYKDRNSKEADNWLSCLRYLLKIPKYRRYTDPYGGDDEKQIAQNKWLNYFKQKNKNICYL